MIEPQKKVELRKSARKRLNYTNLRHLSEGDVRLTVITDAMPPSLRIDYLSLGKRIPDDAEVSVEAYRGSTGEYERFDFGNATTFKSNPHFGPMRQFRRVDDPIGMTYRLKVTDELTGRLIAEIDRVKTIMAGADENPHEFIRVRYRPLGGELWRITVEEDGAFIEIEKSLPVEGIYLWDDPKFQCMIYPAALRLIAEKLMNEERYQDTEWGRKCMTFLRSLAPSFADIEKNSSPEELDQCIDQAARTFANRHNLVGRIKQTLSRELGGK